MENRVNRIVETYFTDFKDEMRSLINNLDIHKDYKNFNLFGAQFFTGSIICKLETYCI